MKKSPNTDKIIKKFNEETKRDLKMRNISRTIAVIAIVISIVAIAISMSK